MILEKIHSSRCGNFRDGIDTLCNNSELLEVLKSQFITGEIPLAEITRAVELAKNLKQNLKVLVKST